VPLVGVLKKWLKYQTYWQCSVFFFRVTTWSQFCVFHCRLRPYHNDLCSPQGDHLIAQCVYNSEGRSTITLGGLTTREEMCLVFALYYPRIDMSLCHSLPSLPTVLHSLGIQELWPWVSKYVLFFFWRDSPQWARAFTFTRFMDHTQRRTTVGSTRLDEWSVRRRDLYLTTHNIHNRHPYPRWVSNTKSQQASGRRPTP